MKRTGTLLLTLLTLTLFMLAPAMAQEEIDETRDVAKDASIFIGNPVGEVIVIGWDRSEVRIEGELGEGTRRLDVEGDEHRLVVEVVIPRRKRYVEDTDLEIHVPRGARVEIDVVSADVRVEGLTNDLVINSVSGDVEIDCRLEMLDVDSVSGDLDLRGETGRCSIETVSGDLELLSDSIKQLEVDSVSGDLELNLVRVDRLMLDTVSGEISFEGSILKRASLESHSGGIELFFDGEPSAGFEISTYNGEIDNSFGPRPHRVDRWEPELELSFESGGGDADIRVETFSGDVVLDTK
ncbi:MAG: DUF4097 domain-containing protein [bacterium]|nr:DUF4097 domain-containing protein [bacterium]